eukprot:m.110287 g.110287  ORF g.110287 m.110287 type:complete len:281 (+) comp16979_c0_seq5:1973-2815(+)
MTETTPIVFNGSLYRFESVRAHNWNNTMDGKPYLRLRAQSGPPAWQTGPIASSVFGVGWMLACAVVDVPRSTVYAFASQEGQQIAVFSSQNLQTWTNATAITLPAGIKTFNTAVGGPSTQATAPYAMAIETLGFAGSGFQIVFATAPTLAGPWTLGGATDAASPVQSVSPSPGNLVFGPGSCPALRFDAASGYWHMLYTPNPTVPGGGYRTWQIYAARSKTLAAGSWELSPQNPILVADAVDRQIHSEYASCNLKWFHGKQPFPSSRHKNTISFSKSPFG